MTRRDLQAPASQPTIPAAPESTGEVAERLNAPVLKTGSSSRGS